MSKLASLSGAARFQAVLATRPCARSAHFMIHHLKVPELSTVPEVDGWVAVDDLPVSGSVRIGMVVPKRHARHAVTRNLVRREMRAGMDLCGEVLAPGDWVVRLRAPFDRRQYVSARSDVLMADVRAELLPLIGEALRHVENKANARRALHVAPVRA